MGYYIASRMRSCRGIRSKLRSPRATHPPRTFTCWRRWTWSKCRYFKGNNTAAYHGQKCLYLDFIDKNFCFLLLKEYATRFGCRAARFIRRFCKICEWINSIWINSMLLTKMGINSTTLNNDVFHWLNESLLHDMNSFIIYHHIDAWMKNTIILYLGKKMLLWIIHWVLFEPEIWTSHKHSVESFCKSTTFLLCWNWNTRHQNGYFLKNEWFTDCSSSAVSVSQINSSCVQSINIIW